MHRPLSRPDRGASMQAILSEVRGAGGAERDAAVRRTSTWPTGAAVSRCVGAEPRSRHTMYQPRHINEGRIIGDDRGRAPAERMVTGNNGDATSSRPFCRLGATFTQHAATAGGVEQQ